VVDRLAEKPRARGPFIPPPASRLLPELEGREREGKTSFSLVTRAWCDAPSREALDLLAAGIHTAYYIRIPWLPVRPRWRRS